MTHGIAFDPTFAFGELKEERQCMQIMTDRNVPNAAVDNPGFLESFDQPGIIVSESEVSKKRHQGCK